MKWNGQGVDNKKFLAIKQTDQSRKFDCRSWTWITRWSQQWNLPMLIGIWYQQNMVFERKHVLLHVSLGEVKMIGCWCNLSIEDFSSRVNAIGALQYIFTKPFTLLCFKWISEYWRGCKVFLPDKLCFFTALKNNFSPRAIWCQLGVFHRLENCRRRMVNSYAYLTRSHGPVDKVIG